MNIGDTLVFWGVISVFSVELLVSYLDPSPPTENNNYRLKVGIALGVLICLKIAAKFIAHL